MWTTPLYWTVSSNRLKVNIVDIHIYLYYKLCYICKCDGDYYGMPWPSWGNPEMKH